MSASASGFEGKIHSITLIIRRMEQERTLQEISPVDAAVLILEELVNKRPRELPRPVHLTENDNPSTSCTVRFCLTLDFRFTNRLELHELENEVGHAKSVKV